MTFSSVSVKTKTNIFSKLKLLLNLKLYAKLSLIIANKEENTREDIERLAQNFPVWVSDVSTLPDAMKMIDQIGTITLSSLKSNELIERIKKEGQRFRGRIWSFVKLFAFKAKSKRSQRCSKWVEMGCT